MGYADVIHGMFRGFGVLLIGGLVHPLVAHVADPLGYIWLLLVAVTAFVAAAVKATPPDTPPGAWRQAPMAAVGGYLLILPLVRVSAGELPPLQLLLTTVTAVLVGVGVGVARTSFYAARTAQPAS